MKTHTWQAHPNQPCSHHRLPWNQRRLAQVPMSIPCTQKDMFVDCRGASQDQLQQDGLG